MRGSQWRAQCLTDRLMRYRSSGESSTAEEHDDEHDDEREEPRVVVCPPGCKPVNKRRRRYREPIGAFDDAEVAAALETMKVVRRPRSWRVRTLRRLVAS